MTWALWLAPPVVATLLAAVWSWLRSRPPRRPSGKAAMRAHQDYLDALAVTLPGCPASPCPPPTRCPEDAQSPG